MTRNKWYVNLVKAVVFIQLRCLLEIAGLFVVLFATVSSDKYDECRMDSFPIS